jgi:hypothetical protein
MLRATRHAVIVAGLLAAVRLAEAQEPTTTEGFHYQTVKPCRLIDTRTDAAGPLVTDTLVPGGSIGFRLFRVRGRCGVPSSAKAVALNLTVPAKDLLFRGHMVAYQANIGLPPTSNVNLTPGATEQNFGIVALAPHPWVDDMQIHLFLADDDMPSIYGVAHAVIDVVGYFFKP